MRASSLARYFLYIGGYCEETWSQVFGLVFPWVAAAVINHMQIFAQLVNWTGLITIAWVQLVCPLFMWSKATKEAHIYETNFRASL